MAQQYDNRGQIVFFPENKGGERAPQYSGAAHLDESTVEKIIAGEIKAGDRLDVALWERNKGVLSGTIKLPYNAANQQQGGNQRPGPNGNDDLDDEIPF